VTSDAILKVGLVHTQVPEHLHEGLIAYILDGRPTGGFLQAAISGDLFQSVARGDLRSQAGLANLVIFLVNHAPAGAFGSYEAYASWVERRGLRGIAPEQVTT
jgi:hypothetical protein